MTPAELKEARRKLGFSARQMAEALSDPSHASLRPPVNDRTIRRWEADGDGSDIPHPVVVAVRMMLERAAEVAGVRNELTGKELEEEQ